MIFHSEADKEAFEKNPSAFAEHMTEKMEPIPYLEDASQQQKTNFLSGLKIWIREERLIGKNIPLEYSKGEKQGQKEWKEELSEEKWRNFLRDNPEPYYQYGFISKRLAFHYKQALKPQELERNISANPVKRKRSTPGNAIPKVDPVTGDPSTAENAIFRGTYYSRQKVDPVTGDPSTAENAISRSAYYSRQKVDPVTGDPGTAENAISRSAYYSQQKVDPVTGDPSTAENAISRSAYYNQKKVDPVTGNASTAENAIPKRTYYNQQKVDPVTGKRGKAENAISRCVFKRKKQTRLRKSKQISASNETAQTALEKRKAKAKKISADTDSFTPLLPAVERNQATHFGLISNTDFSNTHHPEFIEPYQNEYVTGGLVFSLPSEEEDLIFGSENGLGFNELPVFDEKDLSEEDWGSFVDTLFSNKNEDDRTEASEGFSQSETAKALAQSRTEAEKQEGMGPRSLPGWDLEDVKDEGNCFYLAVVDQLKFIGHSFPETVPEGTETHDSLRSLVQGEKFADRQWAGEEEIIETVKNLHPQVIIAIVATSNVQEGFFCYYPDPESEGGVTQERRNAIEDTPRLSRLDIVKLAYTGTHYLSVRSHPALEQGVIRAAMGESSASSATFSTPAEKQRLPSELPAIAAKKGNAASDGKNKRKAAEKNTNVASSMSADSEFSGKGKRAETAPLLTSTGLFGSQGAGNKRKAPASLPEINEGTKEPTPEAGSSRGSRSRRQ